MAKPTATTARKSSPRNTPLPAVTGSAKLLQPVGTVGPAENKTDEIEIIAERVTRAYFVTVHENGYRLHGYDDKREQATVYDIDAACKTCDCPDFVSRAHRRPDHACKHCKAVAALVSSGKLPTVTVPVCKPVEEPEDNDDYLDADTFDDSEADAWHSQFDAA